MSSGSATTRRSTMTTSPTLDYVLERAHRVLPLLRDGTLVIISAQLPVGTFRVLESIYPDLLFSYSPENLRLGRAIDAFERPGGWSSECVTTVPGRRWRPC